MTALYFRAMILYATLSIDTPSWAQQPSEGRNIDGEFKDILDNEMCH